MSRLQKLIVPTVALVSLAGCTGTSPRPLISGTLPASGQYRIDEAAAIAPDLRASVERRLQQHGLTAGPDGNLLVQIAAAERPGDVEGAPAETPAAAHFTAGKSRRLLNGLIVTVSDARTGQELYRGAAFTQVRKNRVTEMGRLADLTLPELKPETRRSQATVAAASR
jgi:hypothetical protein